MHRVVFETPSGPVSAQVCSGTTLMAAARSHGVRIEAPCNGAGTCGKCKVKVDVPTHIRAQGSHRLEAAEEARGWVLACQAPSPW